MSNIDPALLGALKAEEEPAWVRGGYPVVVKTKTGSTYEVDSAGYVRGGHFGVSRGKLVGAIYRPGGPIRQGEIVVGLRMELRDVDRNVVIATSPVESVTRT